MMENIKALVDDVKKLGTAAVAGDHFQHGRRPPSTTVSIAKGDGRTE